MAKKNGVSEAYLDQIFSTYIRLRDADEDGYVLCCYCRGRVHWRESQNCHYVGRRHRTLRWNELNCHAGHASCNGADVILGYTEYMVARYGPDVFSLLNTHKNSREKITPHERKIMADNYKNKIEKLRKEKGL
jgi:hypothetical protein